MQSNAKEREALLDKDAPIFEQIYNVKYTDWKSYLSWGKNFHVAHCYFLDCYAQFYLEELADPIMDIKNTVEYWKGWMQEVTKFENWKNSVPMETIKELKNYVLDGYNNIDHLVREDLQYLHFSEEEINKIFASSDIDKWRAGVLYESMKSAYEAFISSHS